MEEEEEEEGSSFASESSVSPGRDRIENDRLDASKQPRDDAARLTDFVTEVNPEVGAFEKSVTPKVESQSLPASESQIAGNGTARTPPAEDTIGSHEDTTENTADKRDKTALEVEESPTNATP